MPILALTLLGLLPLSAAYARQPAQCMPIAGDPGWQTIANTCRACFHEAAANWLQQAPQKQVYTYEGGDAVAGQVLDQADQAFLTELNGMRQPYLSRQPGPARAQFAAGRPDWAAKKALGEMQKRRRAIDEFILANEERGLESKEGLAALSTRTLPPEQPPAPAPPAATQAPPAPPAEAPPQGTGSAAVPSAAPSATAGPGELDLIAKPTSNEVLGAIHATPGKVTDPAVNEFGGHNIVTTRVDENGAVVQQKIEPNANLDVKRITTQTLTPVDGGVTMDMKQEDAKGNVTQHTRGEATRHVQGVGLASESPAGERVVSVRAVTLDPKTGKELSSYSETLRTNGRTGAQVREIEHKDAGGNPLHDTIRITDKVDPKTGNNVHEFVRVGTDGKPRDGGIRTETNPLSGLQRKYVAKNGDWPKEFKSQRLLPESPGKAEPGVIPTSILSLAPRQASAPAASASSPPSRTTAAATRPAATASPREAEATPSLPSMASLAPSSSYSSTPSRKGSSVTAGQAAVIGMVAGAGAGYLVSTLNRPSAKITRTQRVLVGTDAQGNAVRRIETIDTDGNVVRGRKTVKNPTTGAVTVYVYSNGAYQVVNSTPTAAPN